MVTLTERLEVLEPISEYWHFLVIVIGVNAYNKLQKCYACKLYSYFRLLGKHFFTHPLLIMGHSLFLGTSLAA